MIRYSEVSRRYAAALYELNGGSGTQNKIMDQIRALKKALFDDPEIAAFLTSPLVQPSERIHLIVEALAAGGVDEDLKKLLALLTEKNRLGIFPEIVLAYQDIADAAHGVTRGLVRTAQSLSETERKQVEAMVKKVTGKEVILNYKEDTSVIGGLIAQVGSYVFDDTIESHLRRMKEELNRSAH